MHQTSTRPTCWQGIARYQWLPPHDTLNIHQAIDKLEETIDQLRQQIADMTKQADEHVCSTLMIFCLRNYSNMVCA